MKTLELGRNEIALMAAPDLSSINAYIEQRLINAGFDITKPIESRANIITDLVEYRQYEEADIDS